MSANVTICIVLLGQYPKSSQRCLALARILQAAARPYELASGNPLGSVMVGIPEEQFLELKAKFPSRGFAGQNPKVNEAIKESITEEEKTEIAEHLGIRHTHFTFEFKAARHFIDEANERPSFESNGKKFWIS